MNHKSQYLLCHCRTGRHYGSPAANDPCKTLSTLAVVVELGDTKSPFMIPEQSKDVIHLREYTIPMQEELSWRLPKSLMSSLLLAVKVHCEGCASTSEKEGCFLAMLWPQLRRLAQARIALASPRAYMPPTTAILHRAVYTISSIIYLKN